MRRQESCGALQREESASVRAGQLGGAPPGLAIAVPEPRQAQEPWSAAAWPARSHLRAGGPLGRSRAAARPAAVFTGSGYSSDLDVSVQALLAFVVGLACLGGAWWWHARHGAGTAR